MYSFLKNGSLVKPFDQIYDKIISTSVNKNLHHVILDRNGTCFKAYILICKCMCYVACTVTKYKKQAKS